MFFGALLAAIYPGEPAITPTPDCSVDAAKRCLELREICRGTVGDPISISITALCLKEKKRVCEKCQDAIVEFNMTYWERLFYYGPVWLRYAKRCLFENNEVPPATSGPE